MTSYILVIKKFNPLFAVKMTKMNSSVVVRQRNIERLIARCESIISGKTQLQGKDWKLPKVFSKPIPLFGLERVSNKI